MNIQKHALSVGHLSYKDKPFDKLDSLIFSQLIYMPLSDKLSNNSECTLAEAAEFLYNKPIVSTFDIWYTKRYELMMSCAKLPRYSNAILCNYINDIDTDAVKQFNACTYRLSDGSDYIAFCGTDLTVAGWLEDANLAYKTVPSQIEGVTYTTNVMQQSQRKTRLGGHSKGGNLSIFAASHLPKTLQNNLLEVYSFDGPGFSKEIQQSEGYSNIYNQIHSFIPTSSVVGLLLSYHPIYSVVESDAHNLLQHDVMSWKIKDGEFMYKNSVDSTSQLTDETLHNWLNDLSMDDRKTLLDVLSTLINATEIELITDIHDNRRICTKKFFEALKNLPKSTRTEVRLMLRNLMRSSVNGTIKQIILHFARMSKINNPVENQQQ